MLRRTGAEGSQSLLHLLVGPGKASEEVTFRETYRVSRSLLGRKGMLITVFP